MCLYVQVHARTISSTNAFCRDFAFIDLCKTNTHTPNGRPCSIPLRERVHPLVAFVIFCYYYFFLLCSRFFLFCIDRHSIPFNVVYSSVLCLLVNIITMCLLLAFRAFVIIHAFFVVVCFFLIVLLKYIKCLAESKEKHKLPWWLYLHTYYARILRTHKHTNTQIYNI